MPNGSATVSPSFPLVSQGFGKRPLLSILPTGIGHHTFWPVLVCSCFVGPPSKLSKQPMFSSTRCQQKENTKTRRLASGQAALVVGELELRRDAPMLA